MTTHCVLSPTDYRRMPWKNGGGHTTQIATFPPDAGFASFVWRVSVADVTAGWSLFAVCRRRPHAGAASGARHEAQWPRRADANCGRGSNRSRFPATVLDCSLIAGPVRDFNLMVRRDEARGSIVVCRDEGGADCASGHLRLSTRRPARRNASWPDIRRFRWPRPHAGGDDGGRTTAPRGLRVNPLAAGSIALVAAIRFQ